MKSNTGPPERRSTISTSTMLPNNFNNLRMRNLSGGSSGSATSGSSSNSADQYSQMFLSELTFNSGSSTVPAIRNTGSNCSSSLSHKKLDRSWSDNDNDRNGSHRSVNSSRYKTELCRPFEESGSCKYGDKCQFAHGYHELRNLARHPKYKTELCRTFHTVGFCPYGPRCHFIHEEETKPGDASPKLARSGSVQSSSGSSSPSLSPSGSDDSVFNYQQDNSPPMTIVSVDNSHFNPLTVNTNSNNSSNFDLQALSKQFSQINLNRNNCMDVFTTNNNKEPKIIGSEEHDIFSEITVFSAEELDNAPKPTTSCAIQSMRLDNYPTLVDSPSFWQDSLFSQFRPVDAFHHSPTGSDGSSSSSSGSECGGSTESLINPFTEWRCSVAIGQY